MRVYSKEKNPFQRSLAENGYKNSTCQKYEGVKCLDQEEKVIKIGKYKILLDEVLGKGYSSKVYKGVQDGRDLKKYAIKVIQLKKFSATCLKLFERQIEIHRNLKHDHIVRCYDVYKTKTHIYMVMEYCPHGDLAGFIRQKKNLSQHVIIDIISQIINGYKYLARGGILHRDLKPANVLRSGKIWKISDFGFSIKSDSFIDDVNVGTPLYMPLQSLSRSYYSVKTDIYAIGVILYELLHGRTPWTCRCQKQLLKKLVYDKVTMEKQVKNNKIKEFILKTCIMDEEQRLSKMELDSFDFQPTDSDSTNSLIESNSIFSHTLNYKMENGSSSFDFIKANNQTLMGELHHCRFIYYMIHHIDCFLLKSQQKTVFLMILSKYLLKKIKMLENEKLQNYELIQFDQYKTSESFGFLQAEINDYSAKYQKTYIDHIKIADVKTIRFVNQKFPQFTVSNKNFSSSTEDKSFYSKLKDYLHLVIKQNSDNLNSIINDDGQEEHLAQKIQAFHSLLVLFKIVEMKEKGQTANISYIVTTNYSSSQLLKSDYLNMRKQLQHM